MKKYKAVMVGLAMGVGICLLGHMAIDGYAGEGLKPGIPGTEEETPSEDILDMEEDGAPGEALDIGESGAPEETSDIRESSVPEETLETGESSVPEETLETGESSVPEETLETGESIVPEGTLDIGESVAPEGTLDIGESVAPEGTLDIGESVAPEEALDIGGSGPPEDDIKTDAKGVPEAGTKKPGRGRAQAVAYLQIPQKLEVVIDPWELDGSGQVYSDTYAIRNAGGDGIVLTLDFICKPNEDRGVEVTTDREGLRGSGSKSLYLELVLGDGDRVALGQGSTKYQTELGPGEELPISFAGEVNENASSPWQDGDLAIQAVYSWTDANHMETDGGRERGEDTLQNPGTGSTREGLPAGGDGIPETHLEEDGGEAPQETGTDTPETEPAADGKEALEGGREDKGEASKDKGSSHDGGNAGDGGNVLNGQGTGNKENLSPTLNSGEVPDESGPLDGKGVGGQEEPLKDKEDGKNSQEGELNGDGEGTNILESTQHSGDMSRTF